MSKFRCTFLNVFKQLAVVLILACCATVPESYYVVQDDIIAWWPGDGDSDDIVFDRPGREEGRCSHKRGIIGKAFRFDGTPGESITDLTNMRPTEELTIQAWVKHYTLGEKIQHYVTAVGNCPNVGETIAVLRYGGIDDGLHFFMVFNNEFHHANAPGVLLPGVFHHVAGTYDSDGIRLYCDGVLVDSVEMWKGPCCFEWVAISTVDEPMNGLIDDVKIHDRALEAQEIDSAFKRIFSDREPHFLRREKHDEIVSEPQGFLWRWLEEYPAEPEEIFINSLGATTITIFPTVVHIGGSSESGDEQDGYFQEYDHKSVQTLQNYFLVNEYASIEIHADPIEFPEAKAPQGALMNTGLRCLQSYLAEHPLKTDYMMVVEVVLLPWGENGQGVWGIECYLLNSRGEDAFSLVLNSAWDLFNAANLFASDRSESSSSALVSGAVRTVIDALESHLHQ